MNLGLVRFAPPLAVALGGLGFLCLGAGRVYVNHLYLQEGQQASALVTVVSTGFGGGKSFSDSRSRYQFVTALGERVEGVQTGYYDRLGDQVTIEYLRSRPQWNRYLGSERRYEKLNLPMIVGGLLFLVAGIYSICRSVRLR